MAAETALFNGRARVDAPRGRMAGPSLSTAFFAVWTLLAILTGIVGYRIETAGVPTKRQGEKAATVIGREGDVSVRPEDFLLWSNVGAKAVLMQGDQIATGAGGKVRVRLRGGRILELGENSQVRISQVKGAEGRGGETQFVITVVKGQVAVKAATTGGRRRTGHDQPILLKAGNQTVALDGKGTGLTVVKPIAGDATIKRELAPGEQAVPAGAVAIARNEIKPLPASSGLAAKPAVAAPEKAAPGQAKLEQKTALSAHGLEPGIFVAGEDRASEIGLWTDKPLAQAPPLDLTLLPSRLPVPPGASWTPLLQTGDSATPLHGRPVSAGQARRAQTLTLDPARLARIGRELRLIPGAQIAGAEGGISRSFAPKRATVVHLNSVRELPPRSMVTLVLDAPRDVPASDASSASSPAWVREDPSLPTGAGLRLTLAHAEDLPKVWALVRAARRFRVHPEAPNADDASLCLVRGGEVIATAQPSSAARSVAALLMAQLGADFAFEGPAAALVARLEDLPEESRMVFVYNKALGYPTYLVSRPFLRQAEAAAGFVEDTSAAIFREPVVIVAERRPSSALLTQ